MTGPVRSIEVFADITCPFTHVGLHRLVERRRQLGREDVRLHIRAWPLELVNGAPICPTMIQPKIDQLRANVAPDLFIGFDPATFPASTLPALMLAAHADTQDPAVGERVNLLLRDALFEEGRDVSDADVLADMAHTVGLSTAAGTRDRDHVMADWRDGRARGVLGSPHFFVDEEGFFCPALAISHTDGELRITFDAEGFARFAHACFDR